MIYPPLSPKEKAGVLRLLEAIEREDIAYRSGSCGDGSYDRKVQKHEHEERKTALRVIKGILQ